MAKRPSLAESMKAAAKAPVSGPELTADVRPESAAATPDPLSTTAASGYRAKTREGMKRLTVVVAPAEHRRVKRLSADTDRSIEDLMREALTALLEKHNA